MNDEAGALARRALDEAQTTVRAYDTKAQIVGVGYIFALGVVARIGEQLDTQVEVSVFHVIVAWATLILPAVLFGLVLYPSRFVMGRSDHRSVLYTRPGDFETPEQYAEAARRADPLIQMGQELIKVTELRETKRQRFLRALFAAGVSLVVLLSSHILLAAT